MTNYDSIKQQNLVQLYFSLILIPQLLQKPVSILYILWVVVRSVQFTLDCAEQTQTMQI